MVFCLNECLFQILCCHDVIMKLYTAKIPSCLSFLQCSLSMINDLFVFLFLGVYIKATAKAPTTAPTGATSSLTPPLEEEPPAVLEAEALEPLDFSALAVDLAEPEPEAEPEAEPLPPASA